MCLMALTMLIVNEHNLLLFEESLTIFFNLENINSIGLYSGQ